MILLEQSAFLITENSGFLELFLFEMQTIQKARKNASENSS